MINVIVPVYNGEKYIKTAIESILNSSFRDLEVIIVDDGSTDSSLSIIKEMRLEDERIRIYTKKNGGIAEARQYGLDRAEAEYVCFMDQDDIVEPFAYEMLVRDIELSGADFAQGQVGHYYNDGRKIDICNKDKLIVYKSGTDDYKKALKHLIWKGCPGERDIPLIVGAGIYMNLFRRSFLLNNNIKIRRFCDYEDDWILGAETLSKANIVCVNTKTTYLWRIHEESTLHNNKNKDRYIEDLYEKYCKYREFMFNCLLIADLSFKEQELYKQEQVRQTWLWCLSNETGRGIEGRSLSQSVQYMKEVMKDEKQSNYYKGSIKLFKPLSMSGYGLAGFKYYYHRLRDVFLVFMLKHNMIMCAVYLNKKVLHGRWHI